MKNKLFSWSNYLYIAVALSVMMSLRDDNREQFYQFVLVCVFFVLTGIKDNIKNFRGFVVRFPLYTALTVAASVYFYFINAAWPTSDRYAYSVFSIIFAGYSIISLKESGIEVAFEKLWVLLLLLGFTCLFNALLSRFSGRMVLFYTNPNMEGYALVIFLCITLLFIRDIKKVILGSLFSIIALVYTGSKACTLVAAFLLMGYVHKIFRGRKFKAYIKNRGKLSIIVVAVMITTVLCFFAKIGKNLIVNLVNRYTSAIYEVVRLLTGYNQPADWGTTTYTRVMAAMASLEIFPSNNAFDIIFGRGLMHQHFLDLRPIISRIYVGNAATAGAAENTFLSIMYDSGMFAFAFYVGVFVAAILCLIKCEDKILKKIAVIIVVLMVMGLTADIEYLINIMCSEWIFIGMFIGRLYDNHRKRLLIPGTSLGIGMIIIVFYLPRLIAFLRTITNGMQVINSFDYIWKAYFVLTTLVIGVIVFNISVSTMLYKTFKNKRLHIKSLYVCLVAAVSIALSVVVGKVCIDRIQNSISERIDAEEEVLRDIGEVSDTNIYVYTFPNIYKRIFSNIRDSVLCSRGLCAYDNTTILVDKSVDSHVFGDRGFLYAEISEWDSIYTNDEEVINYMEQRGIHMTGYSTYISTISGKIDETQYVYPGDYTATYNIKGEVKDWGNEKLDNLKIIINDETRGNVVVEKELEINFSNHSRQYAYDVEFYTNGGLLRFDVGDDESNEMEIESITYKRTPKTDTHVKIDELGRIIHEEYYNADGSNQCTTAGYYGMDKEYDSKDNCITEKYLDQNGKLVANKYGYSICRYEFNDKKQIIKEVYYDENDENITLDNNEASVEFEYDDEGNRTVLRYYDINGLLQKIEKRLYDKNRLVRIDYQYCNNDLAINLGISRIDYQYDENGEFMDYIYYDLQGNIIEK